MTERENGHWWGFWKQDAFECCRDCAGIRRADRKNLPCSGKAHLELREPPCTAR